MNFRRGLVPILALLLAALPLIGALAAPASAATSRVAIIQSLSGTVQVKKSGGSKQFKAFAKMSLNEGDVLTTSANGKAVLQFANGTSEDDKMSVSANTTLTFSKLSDRNGTRTKVSMFNGQAWVDVKSISTKNDEFTLETPTAVMGVRGTHLMVSVDPLTGETRLTVAAGVVNTQPAGEGAPTDVLPGDHALVTKDEEDIGEVHIAPADLDALMRLSPADLIEAILNAASEIAQENEQKMEQYLNHPNGPDTSNSAELDRIKGNIENLLGAIVESASNSGKITQDKVQELISNAEARTGFKVDLSKREIALTEQEKRRQEALEQQAERRRQQAERQKQLEEERRGQQEGLLKRIEEEKRKQEEEQLKALEEKRRQAEAAYLRMLSEAEKSRFEQDRNDRERETGAAANQSPGSNAGPTQPDSSESPSPSPSPSPTPATKPQLTDHFTLTQSGSELPIRYLGSFEMYGEHYSDYSVKVEADTAELTMNLVFQESVRHVSVERYEETLYEFEGDPSEPIVISDLSLPLIDTYTQYQVYYSTEDYDYYAFSVTILKGEAENLSFDIEAVMFLYGETNGIGAMPTDPEQQDRFVAFAGPETLDYGMLMPFALFEDERVVARFKDMAGNDIGHRMELELGWNEFMLDVSDLSGYYRKEIPVRLSIYHGDSVPEQFQGISIAAEPSPSNPGIANDIDDPSLIYVETDEDPTGLAIKPVGLPADVELKGLYQWDMEFGFIELKEEAAGYYPIEDAWAPIAMIVQTIDQKYAFVYAIQVMESISYFSLDIINVRATNFDLIGTVYFDEPNKSLKLQGSNTKVELYPYLGVDDDRIQIWINGKRVKEGYRVMIDPVSLGTPIPIELRSPTGKTVKHYSLTLTDQDPAPVLTQPEHTVTWSTYYGSDPENTLTWTYLGGYQFQTEIQLEDVYAPPIHLFVEPETGFDVELWYQTNLIQASPDGVFHLSGENQVRLEEGPHELELKIKQDGVMIVKYLLFINVTVP